MRRPGDVRPQKLDQRLPASAGGLQRPVSKIDGLLRKWLALPPHPFAAADRAAGSTYDISHLQAEFFTAGCSTGRCADSCSSSRRSRENLDLGRPQQVQLVFDAA